MPLWPNGFSRSRVVVAIASRLKRDPHEIAGRLMVLHEWIEQNIRAEDVDANGDASVAVGDDPACFLDALVGLPQFAETLASPDISWIDPPRPGRRLVFLNCSLPILPASEPSEDSPNRVDGVLTVVDGGVDARVDGKSLTSKQKAVIRTQKWRENRKKKTLTPPSTKTSTVDASLTLDGITSTKGEGVQVSSEEGLSKKKEKRSSKKKFDPSILELPKELDTPEVRVALAEWVQYLQATGVSKMLKTNLTFNKMFKAFAPLGPERLIAAIDCSIASGWNSVHEGKQSRTRGLFDEPKKREQYCPNGDDAKFMQEFGIHPTEFVKLVDKYPDIAAYKQRRRNGYDS